MKKHTPNPELEAFAARLRQAMKDAGLKSSATQLANAFNMRYWGEGITAHAARNWMIGVSMPKQDKLKTLGDVLQISPQDLLFGPSTPHPQAKESPPSALMCMGDAEMLKQYLLLTPEHKCMIRHFVKLARIYQQMMKPDNGDGKTDSNKT
jgi:hypothetical protein